MSPLSEDSEMTEDERQAMKEDLRKHREAREKAAKEKP